MWVHNCDGKPLSEFLWEKIPDLRVDPDPRRGCRSEKRIDLKPVCDLIEISRFALLPALAKGKLRYKHINRLKSRYAPDEAPDAWLQFVSESY